MTAAALCGLHVVATPTMARAATPAEIAALRAQPCPEYRVGRSNSYSTARAEAANSGVFDVWRGLEAKLVPPVDWRQDPYRNWGWTHYLHAFLWLDQLLYSYVELGDRAALARARDLLLDWVAANPPGGAGTSREAWKDKATSERAAYLAYVTRTAACRGMLADAQASLLLDSLDAHADRLIDPDLYDVHNHGMFTDYGLALLGNYLGYLARGQAWLDLARARFRTTLTALVEEREGVWLENSSTYQFVAIRLVDRFAELVGSTSFADLRARMRDAAGWILTPAGTTVPFGNSNVLAAPEWALRHAANDHGLRLMKRSGLAAVKDRGGYLLVTAMFHNDNHKQADDLGFHLYDRGRDLISDTGLYHHDPDKWNKFSRSVRAHSVLSLGSKGFPVTNERRAYGSGIRAGGSGAGWYAIEGRNPLLRRKGVRHRRLFLYRPGRALAVIDLLRAKKRRTYRRRFQLAPGIAAARRPHGLTLSGRRFSGAMRYGAARPRLVNGSLDPVGGWSFPSFRTRIPRTTVELRTKARDAEYAVAFGLRGGAKAKVLSSRRRTVTVRVGGAAVRDATLRIKRRGKSLRVLRGRSR